MSRMIKWKLNAVMGEKFVRGNALAELTGMSKESISRLRNTRNLKRIEADTLEKLCSALECQPGDLMEWVPDEELKAS